MLDANAAPQPIPVQLDASRRKPKDYSPKAETLALLKASGNSINGLGETAQRRPSPFFWHPPTMHPFEDLQIAARAKMSQCPGYDAAFSKARNHPDLIPIAATRREATAEEFTSLVSEFALSHEADDIGITPTWMLLILLKANRGSEQYQATNSSIACWYPRCES
jgi:epoxyqueuosine reductase